jgi:hypothetical protein
MGRAYIKHGIDENTHTILIGRPEGKRPHGRTSHRWEDTIVMNLTDSVGSVDWIHVTQYRDQNSSEHGNEPSGSIKVVNFLIS